MTYRDVARSALALALILLAVPVAAGDEMRLALEDDQVFVAYQAAVGQEQVSGFSRVLAGSVVVAPEEGQVRLHVPVASFASGLGPADVALRSALEADRFPTVEFEGRAPNASGDEATLRFEGRLRLHGQERAITVPVRVAREGRFAVAHATFFISLDAFGVARPRLAGVTVGDRVRVDVLARVHAQSPGTKVAAF